MHKCRVIKVNWIKSLPVESQGCQIFILIDGVAVEDEFVVKVVVGFVGDVSEATLKNIVIDNFLFGVASVSKDGNESVVVFPTSLIPRRR